MSQKILSITALISLILCTATAVLWARSKGSFDIWSIHRPSAYASLMSSGGTLCIDYVPHPDDRPWLKPPFPVPRPHAPTSGAAFNTIATCSCSSRPTMPRREPLCRRPGRMAPSPPPSATPSGPRTGPCVWHCSSPPPSHSQPSTATAAGADQASAPPAATTSASHRVLFRCADRDTPRATCQALRRALQLH